MGKYIMRGSKTLVIFFEEKLRSFSPGEVIEANQPPHQWFKEVLPIVKAKGFKTGPTADKKPRIKFED